MTVNMGKLDRIGRLVIAAALVIWAFATPWAAAPVLHWLALLVAAVFGVTAAVSTCPLYSIVGLKTCQDC